MTVINYRIARLPVLKLTIILLIKELQYIHFIKMNRYERTCMSIPYHINQFYSILREICITYNVL